MVMLLTSENNGTFSVDFNPISESSRYAYIRQHIMPRLEVVVDNILRQAQEYQMRYPNCRNKLLGLIGEEFVLEGMKLAFYNELYVNSPRGTSHYTVSPQYGDGKGIVDYYIVTLNAINPPRDFVKINLGGELQRLSGCPEIDRDRR